MVKVYREGLPCWRRRWAASVCVWRSRCDGWTQVSSAPDRRAGLRQRERERESVVFILLNHWTFESSFLRSAYCRRCCSELLVRFPVVTITCQSIERLPVLSFCHCWCEPPQFFFQWSCIDVRFLQTTDIFLHVTVWDPVFVKWFRPPSTAPPPETFSPAVIWCGVAPFFAQKNYFYDLDHFYWPCSHLLLLYVTNILVNIMPD